MVLVANILEGFRFKYVFLELIKAVLSTCCCIFLTKVISEIWKKKKTIAVDTGDLSTYHFCANGRTLFSV